MADKLSISEYANQEVRYGVIPMLSKERLYSFWDMAFVTGAYAIATWCYFHGAELSEYLGFRQALFSTFGAICAFIALIAIIGVISSRYGIDHWIYSRAVFGYKGVMVVFLVSALSSWGWTAINAQMYGSSMLKVANATPLSLSEERWFEPIALTCVFFGWAIAMKGPTAVRYVTRIMTLALLAVGVIVVALLLIKASPSEIWNAQAVSPAEPGEVRMQYMLATEWNIAFALSWFTVIGALTRLAKSERAAMWGIWWGYAFIMAVFILIGAAVSVVVVGQGAEPTGDVTDYLLELGGPGLGLISLIFVGVANITTQAVELYAMSVSTKILRPSWSYRWVCTFWALTVAGLVMWGGVWEYYGTFLAIMGVIAGPVVTLVILDYFVVRRQRVSVTHLYKKGVYQYSGGFNVVAFLAFAAGVVAFLAVYDPIAYEARSTVFMYTTATGASVIGTTVAYLILWRIPPLQRYLLKDRDAVGETREAARELVGESLPAGEPAGS